MPQDAFKNWQNCFFAHTSMGDSKIWCEINSCPATDRHIDCAECKFFCTVGEARTRLAELEKYGF